LLQKRELSRVFRDIELPFRPCILEIGCGSGHALKMLQDVFQPEKLYGIDVDGEAIKKAQKLFAHAANVNVSVGDATELRFDNNSFDAVFSFAVLHHVALWQKAILETGRVLKAGGVFVLLEVVEEAFRIPLVKLIDGPDAIFSRGEVIAALEKAGFSIKILRWRGWYWRWIKASILCIAEKK